MLQQKGRKAMAFNLETRVREILKSTEYTTISEANPSQFHMAVAKAVMGNFQPKWKRIPIQNGRRVGYFSAEFLMGRMIESNLLNVGLLNEAKQLANAHHLPDDIFEKTDDAALGNGGLGRLAACFLDSAATQGVPLDGYGIRYRYGLFRQYFENGYQREKEDDWTKNGDPWSVRCEQDRVTVDFGKQQVYAVPYDMPIIGYGGKTINTLRLWQAEAAVEFDFSLFNEQKYEKAFQKRNEAESISSVLYPNDDTDKGKQLRLKQQYFFCSASLQDMFRRYRQVYGNDYTRFHEVYAIQLNDTHPVVSVPECVRLLMEEGGLPFDTALAIVRNTFAYTNHTIMPEALETWNIRLFRSVLPRVYRYILKIDQALKKELTEKGITDIESYRIVDEERIHMARMALFATHSVNGVAQLHTELLKQKVLPQWYSLYPERFNNKTNGVTQRRWLALANEELSGLITETIGNRWITNLDRLRDLEPYADDPSFLEQLRRIKSVNKQQLSEYIQKRDGLLLNTEFLLDVQVKRLHEYKRQLLNAFSVLDTYFGLKDGRINDFTPTAYLFGGKAAPGYYHAKAIIKFINEIARVIRNDPQMGERMQVIFVSNYDGSYAEKIIPATDISEQISTAGTEASGTGNMKFMMNGAITLGTYDGANIEIVDQVGEENAYIFGARVEELEKMRIEHRYHPQEYLERSQRLSRVVRTLIDGTFDDGGSGMFAELYRSLTDESNGQMADRYFLFHDFECYCEARMRANREYDSQEEFDRMRLKNIAASGYFSSDRTIRGYAEEIWNV